MLRATCMIATGFLRSAPAVAAAESGASRTTLDDIVGTTSMTFLGVTVGCARCHNHKFDPIPQKDYYRIQAVFFSTRPNNYPLVPRRGRSPQTAPRRTASSSCSGRSAATKPHSRRRIASV